MIKPLHKILNDHLALSISLLQNYHLLLKIRGINYVKMDRVSHFVAGLKVIRHQLNMNGNCYIVCYVFSQENKIIDNFLDVSRKIKQEDGIDRMMH